MAVPILYLIMKRKYVFLTLGKSQIELDDPHLELINGNPSYDFSILSSFLHC